jgi:hypothetical protein
MTDPEPKNPSVSARADRRRRQRFPAAPGARVGCRRGCIGTGPDLALSVLDVSASGIRLLVNAPLSPGEAVEVNLGWSAGGRVPRHPARVAWSAPAARGAWCVGVRFREPLSCFDLMGLAEG